MRRDMHAEMACKRLGKNLRACNYNTTFRTYIINSKSNTFTKQAYTTIIRRQVSQIYVKYLSLRVKKKTDLRRQVRKEKMKEIEVEEKKMKKKKKEERERGRVSNSRNSISD